MNYVKSIQTNPLNDVIDYEHVRKLFKNLFQKNTNTSFDHHQYDWVYLFSLENLLNPFIL